MPTWQTVAAANNAAWCDIVARAHGASTRTDACAWTSRTRTPPYYPDAVTLVPDPPVAALLDRIDTSPGCSIKDSFASIDLTPWGFEVLFDAEWIVLVEPVLDAGGDALDWREVTDSQTLAIWEDAWRQPDGPRGVFRDEILDQGSVAVLAGWYRGRILAGVVANRSRSAVGVSNFFSDHTGVSMSWRGCVASVQRVFPDTPLVGYESANRLQVAMESGFHTAGALRIWGNDI